MSGRKRKRITKRKKSQSPIALVTIPRVPRKRKQWTNEQMEQAMKAVQSGSLINQAALDHGVPPTTLKDRLSGRVQHGVKPGPKQYLSSEEETELAAFLKSCASVGYGKTRRDVMGIAESVAMDKGILRGHRISQGWWRQFIKRQNDLSLRRGDNCAQIRMNAINHDTMNHYFDLLESTLNEHNLLQHPSQIYNVDESGIPLDPKSPNIVSKRGIKKVRYRSGGKKGQITVVACGNAIGQVIPPMVIFDAKNLNHHWTADEVPGTKYGLSDKGWITSELFEGWLVEHFLEHAVSRRPLLLLLDGHSTHYQPDVIRLAKENGVIMLCLPPHTTHETQPLDCGVFAPLKAHWTNVCHSYFQKNPGKVVTKFNFNFLFSKAWFLALTPANLIAGFKTCGVYPLNRSAIAIDCCDSTGRDHSSDDALEDENVANSNGANVSDDSSSDESGGISLGNKVPDTQHPVFDSMQEELFQRRFDEGYNLCTDPDYNRWLKINHPGVQQLSVHSSNEESTFSGVDQPQPVSTAEVTGEIKDLDSGLKSPSVCMDTLSSTPNSSRKSSPTLFCGSSSHKSNASLSKILDDTVLSTPTTSSSCQPRAKLLTSMTFIAMLEEKEKKKQQAIEEKERNKREREEKRKKRQEELEKRVKEREEKKKQKEEEKKRKAEEKEKRIKERGKGKFYPKSMKSTTSMSSVSVTRNGAKRKCSPSTEPQNPMKKIRSKCDEINPDVCCICFSTYEEDMLDGTGIEWISCACGRWLHEDCAEDRELDDEGKELFCPYCIV